MTTATNVEHAYASNQQIESKGYRLLRACGSGASSEVYEAEHVATGQRVALKLCHSAASGSSARVRFFSEAAILAELESPHIPRLLDEHCQLGFFVMELLEGDTLEVAADEPLAPARVAAIMAELALALEAVHERGIVHCDIKPENVLLARAADGSVQVKLVDFGIARCQAHESTTQGDWFGTPLYMCPEQAAGKGGQLDVTTDTWAYAMLAYRLVSGRHYYPIEALQRTLLRVAYDPVIAPSAIGCRVSPAFDAWFLRSCSRDPSQRFRSVREQSRALEEALSTSKQVRIEACDFRPSWICDGPDLRTARRNAPFGMIATLGLVSALAMSVYASWP